MSEPTCNQQLADSAAAFLAVAVAARAVASAIKIPPMFDRMIDGLVRSVEAEALARMELAGVTLNVEHETEVTP